MTTRDSTGGVTRREAWLGRGALRRPSRKGGSLPKSAALLCAFAAGIVAQGADAAQMPFSAVWPEEYRSLSVLPGEDEQLHPLNDTSGNPDGHLGQARAVPLPFDFEFFGTSYRALNLGAKGYVTFGTSTSDHSASRGADALTRDATPRNLVAGWWGDHFCKPADGIRSKVVGTAPRRAFVIQWDGCSKRIGTGATLTGSDTTFEAQIWLFEEGGVVRVKYGKLARDPAQLWPTVSWGLKAASGQGWVGPDRSGKQAPCDPITAQGGLPQCSASFFPADSAIQYGHSPEVDLAGRIKWDDLVVRSDGFGSRVTTTLLNLSSEWTTGAGFDLYLSTSRAQVAGTAGSFLIHSHQVKESLTSGESRDISVQVDASRPPNGNYRVCAFIDPDATLPERDRSNNWICSHERIWLGPDLVGTISAPSVGEPGGLVKIPLTIENIGNDRAGGFNFSIVMKPAVEEQGVPTERVYFGRVDDGLDAQTSIALEPEVRLPSIARGDAYVFELRLDVDEEVDEADRSNNVSVSSNQMTNNRPELRISAATIDWDLSEGCFFGEPIVATFEVCNAGKAQALGFTPGVVMGDGTQISAGFDVTAASSPQFCAEPGTWNYSACEPVRGQGAECAFDYCRLSCSSDDDCDGGERCALDPLLGDFLGDPGAKSCRNYLSFGTAPRGERCRTYTVRGKIPMEDQVGAGYSTSPQRFHFIDDVTHSLSQIAPSVVASEVFACRPALLDLAAISIEPTSRLVAGKAVSIRRLIRNEGFTNFLPGGLEKAEEESYTYRYFLSSSPDVSTHQIPLDLQSTGGAGRGSIGRKSESFLTELVEIPNDVPPGEYYLGLILDPKNELVELEKSNNTFVLPEPIEVEPAGLEIITKALPRAQLGAAYSHVFVAKAGLGAYRWSARNLPPGMELREDGAFYGVPELEGVFAFTVQVEAGGAATERMIALQVLPGQSELMVATETLPLAIRGAPYGRWFDRDGEIVEGVQLAASGGTPPYSWRLDSSAADSRLPEGLDGLTEDGVIRGQPTLRSTGAEFLVEVTDSLGNRASRWLEMLVVDQGTLRLSNRQLPLGTSGEGYHACVEAAGGDGVYRFEIDRRSLPPGLSEEAVGAQLCLTGTPTACGNFEVEVLVSEGQGQSATVAIALSIECGAIQLNARDLRPIDRGEEVSFQLRAIPSDTPKFSIVRGRLPEGLSMSGAGAIEGTVSDEARGGPYNLVLELSDELGRRSLSALTLRVNQEPGAVTILESKKTVGCQSAGSPDTLTLWSLVGGIFLLGRVGRSGSRRSRAGARAAFAHAGAGGAGGGSQRERAELSSLPPHGESRSQRGRLTMAGIFWGTAFLVAGMGLACGGETITKTETRCSEVECRADFVCDEDDGLCKCGGLVACEEGDVCVLEPAPHCVAERCAFASCDRGQSCLAETGECACGQTPCEEDEYCVEGACVAPDRCVETTCGEGMRCDPADGSCKCDGIVCDADERCLEGVCTADRCAGVNCGANSSCNPEDGACHCGGLDGSICSSGEACVEGDDGDLACAISTKCDLAVCVGGTVCDPDDGLCRCGGVGTEHPVCEQGQSCVAGACRGGLLCAPGGIETVCEPGLECDPLDGLCKCGGKHGSFCGEGEACTDLGGTHLCTKTCTLLAAPSDCGKDEGCYYDPGQKHGEAFCAPGGLRSLNEDCTISSDCAPGLHCSQAQECTQLCDVRDGPGFCSSIGPMLECISFLGDYGYCRAP